LRYQRRRRISRSKMLTGVCLLIASKGEIFCRPRPNRLALNLISQTSLRGFMYSTPLCSRMTEISRAGGKTLAVRPKSRSRGRDTFSPALYLASLFTSALFSPVKMALGSSRNSVEFRKLRESDGIRSRPRSSRLTMESDRLAESSKMDSRLAFGRRFSC
jgi:hypothetical protein